MDASIIIPTRNRLRQLERCLGALAMQDTRREFEVIVVDDANPHQVELGDVSLPARTRVVRSGGVGPARARNRGLADATSPLILFTDDDTAPSGGWVEAACTYLDGRAQHVGVEGPTVSPPFDPLYERSIRNDQAGAYWTCNVAYRRDALIRLGGFADAFPSAHAEDLDLGFRARQLGPIGFASEMVVTHYPASMSLSDALRNAGRYASSDLVLYRRHPELFASRIPLTLRPAVSQLRYMRRLLREERSAMVGTPRRLLRFSITVLGITVIAPWQCWSAGQDDRALT